MSINTKQFVKRSTSNGGTIILGIGGTVDGIYENVNDLDEAVVTSNLQLLESGTLFVDHADDSIGTNVTTEQIIINGSAPNINRFPIRKSFFRIRIHADQGTVINSDVEVGFSKIILNSNSDNSGRLKVSKPIVFFSSTQTNHNNHNWDTITVGTGQVFDTTNFSQSCLRVSSIGDKVIRQQRGYNVFQKSISCHIKGTLIESFDPNVRSRIGYFDDVNNKTIDDNPSGNGFFFQVNGNVVSVVHRSSNDSTVPPVVPPTQTDTVIDQSNWNIDHLDGTGPSNLNIDFTKQQHYVISISDVVFMGIFYINEIVWCHKFINNSSINLLSQFSLPIRYEIEATGVIASDGIMRQMSAQTIFNSELDVVDLPIFSTCQTTLKTIGKKKEIPVVSLRLNKTNTAEINPRIRLSDLHLFLTSTRSSIMLYRIYKVYNAFTSSDSGPLTNPVWINQSNLTVGIKGSFAEYDTNSKEIDLTGYNYSLIEHGYFSSYVPINNKKLDTFVSSDISGHSDLIVITAKSLSGNITTLGTIQWREFV